ncbi:hypothetical protein LXL04_020037 [Taraxacum kok-saghyz]
MRKEELQSSKQALGLDASLVQFVVGDAKTLLLNNYRDADLVVIDFNLENHERILWEQFKERALILCWDITRFGRIHGGGADPVVT